MHEWYKVLYLVTSNLPLLIVVARSIWRGRYDKAGIALGTCLMSIKYHLAQTGVWVPETFESAQIADHTWVTIYYWYFTIYYLQFILIERFILIFVVVWLVTAFPAYLVQTTAFYLIYGLSLIAMAAMQLFYRRKKFPRFGVLLFLTGTALGGIGLIFFFFNDGVNTPTYWWAHGSWHWCVLLAVVLIDLAEDYKMERLWDAWDKANHLIEWEHKY